MKSWRQSFRLARLLQTSRYILLQYDTPLVSLMKVKPNQRIVQLWHGPGALKKAGRARTDKKGSRLRQHFTHRNYTYVLTTSGEPSQIELQAASFNIDPACVKPCGYPRTDVFFDAVYRRQTASRLEQQYPFLKDKKVILFAPTFRGALVTQAHYDFSQLDLPSLYSRLANQGYIMVFKWHPAIWKYDANLADFSARCQQYPDFFYDLSAYPEVNDLLMVCDVMVTDYSSVIFEYALLDKPAVMFVNDLAAYQGGRGFYYPFADYVFGPVAENCSQLIDSITSPAVDEEKRAAFIAKFMGACDGASGKRVYDLIFNEEIKK